MLSASENHESDEKAASRSKAAAWLLRGIRLALIGVVIYLGWTTVAAFRVILSGPRATAVTPTESEDSSALPTPVEAMAALPPEGFWTCAGLRWKVGAAELDGRSLRGRLSAVERASVDSPAHVGGDEQKLIESLDRLPLKKDRRLDRVIYRLDQPSVRLLVVTQDSPAGPRLVGAAAAYPLDRSRWMLWELLDKSIGRGSIEGPLEHLLPLPEDARQVIGRCDRENQLLFELVDLRSHPDALALGWRAKGWDVRRAEFGGRYSYLCSRGKTIISVWAPDQREQAPLLILARIPDAVLPGENTASQR